MHRQSPDAPGSAGGGSRREVSGGEGIPGAGQRPESPNALAPLARQGGLVSHLPVGLWRRHFAATSMPRCGAWHAPCLGRSVLGAGPALGAGSSMVCKWYLFPVRDDRGPRTGGHWRAERLFVVTGQAAVDLQKRGAEMGIGLCVRVGGQPQAAMCVRAGECRAPGWALSVWVHVGTVYFWSGQGPRGCRCFWSKVVCGSGGWRVGCDGCICGAGCLAGGGSSGGLGGPASLLGPDVSGGL